MATLTYSRDRNLDFPGQGSGSEKTGFSLDGIVTAGIFVFLGYLFLAGIIGFSGQLQILLLIGGGIWFLTRK
jgi:hypothetical protein